MEEMAIQLKVEVLKALAQPTRTKKGPEFPGKLNPFFRHTCLLQPNLLGKLLS